MRWRTREFNREKFGALPACELINLTSILGSYCNKLLMIQYLRERGGGREGLGKMGLYD